MAKTNLYSGRNIASNTGQTSDSNIGQGESSTSAAAGTKDTRSTVRVTGTYSNLYMRVSANASTGTTTFAFQKAALNGTQTLNIAAAATGEFEDTSGTDAVSAADVINCQTINGGGGVVTRRVYGEMFTATSNSSALFGTFNALCTPGQTNYQRFNGIYAATSEDASMQLPSSVAGTIKNGNCGIVSNTISVNGSYVSRKNGANGNIAVVVTTGGGSGQFEDTSGSDTIVAGDSINRAATAAAGTGATAGLYLEVLETTNSKMLMVLGSTSPDQTFAASTTRYMALCGLLESSTSAVFFQTKVGVATEASDYQFYVSANTVVGSSTLTLQKNGAAATGTITVPGLGTGWFQDLSSEDALVSTDELAWQAVAGAAGTSFALSAGSLLFDNGFVLPGSGGLSMMGIG